MEIVGSGWEPKQHLYKSKPKASLVQNMDLRHVSRSNDDILKLNGVVFLTFYIGCRLTDVEKLFYTGCIYNWCRKYTLYIGYSSTDVKGGLSTSVLDATDVKSAF